MYLHEIMSQAAEIEDKSLHLLKTMDHIFLQGFSSHLTRFEQLKKDPAFLTLKQQIIDADDAISTTIKLKVKMKSHIFSISDRMLENGHNFAKRTLDHSYYSQLYKPSEYASYAAMNEHKLLVLHTLPICLEDVKIDRQAATFSSFSKEAQLYSYPVTNDVVLYTRQRMPGFVDAKLPLSTAKGGLSGKMAETIEQSIGQMRGQLEHLVTQPKAVHLFEDAIKLSKGLHL